MWIVAGIIAWACCMFFAWSLASAAKQADACMPELARHITDCPDCFMSGHGLCKVGQQLLDKMEKEEAA